MATTTIVPATQTVDEEKFINKLYDGNLSNQKQTLQDNYTQNNAALDSEKQSVQQQTDTNITRTNVEADRAAQADGPMLSGGANAQAALSRGNQRQQNVTTLRGAQSEADAEIERERAILGTEFEAAIKQAQADNDMERAQQLYEAAKTEDARLTEYKRTSGNLLAEKGDYSVLADLYGLTEEQARKLGGNMSGLTPTASTAGTGTAAGGAAATGEYATPEALADDEKYLREIYDSSLESQKQGLTAEHEREMSDLRAEQEATQKETDEKLTQAYVDAMKKAKNYNEVQTAYGMGSGTRGQAQLAQDLQLQNDLTALRGVQMDTDAKYGRQGSDLTKQYLDDIADAQADSDKQFVEKLIEAGQEEEEKQIGLQLEAGNLLAGKNDYSILGALYGLTQDQIDRLQGTGAYAPVYVAPSSGGGNLPSTSIPFYKELATPKEVDSEKNLFLSMKRNK